MFGIVVSVDVIFFHWRRNEGWLWPIEKHVDTGCKQTESQSRARQYRGRSVVDITGQLVNRVEVTVICTLIRSICGPLFLLMLLLRYHRWL